MREAIPGALWGYVSRRRRAAKKFAESPKICVDRDVWPKYHAGFYGVVETRPIYVKKNRPKDNA